MSVNFTLFEYIAIVISVGALVLGYLMYFRKSKQITVHEDKQPNESTSQLKLKDLIDEIDLFVNRWKRHYVGKIGYRRHIESKTITDDDCNKITNHSWNIQTKINPVKNLGIKNADIVLDLVGKIADRMTDLGVDIENKFQFKLMKQVSTVTKYEIDTLIFEGDKICDDLKSVKKQLVNLVKDLL